MKKTKIRIKRRGIVVLLVATAIVTAVITTLVTSIAMSHTKDSVNVNSHTVSAASADPKSMTMDSLSAINMDLVTEPTVTYESLGEFTLTAYCPCVQCCGIWSAEHPSRIGTSYIQKTKTGAIPTEGRTIGVDPNVIPFGSVIMINGHEYVAEDVGGAIQGNIIDIFFSDHDKALEFGRQSAEVFIKVTGED